MTATAALSVGVVGLGTMGQNHLRNLRARSDVRVVAVADPIERARSAVMADLPDARPFADATTLLDDTRPDALIVATPTTSHHEIALAALAMGIPVLLEKPLAASVEQGRDLVRAVASSGVLLQVGHVERFNPAVRALYERLQGGALTRIFSIRTVRGGPLPERIRDVGVGVDLATHDIDVMCLLLGDRPSRVYGETTRNVHTTHEDLLYGLLVFPTGVLGLLDVNWLTPRKERAITVLGAEGVFSVDYLRQTLTFTKGSGDDAPSYLGGYAPTFVGETLSLPVVPAEPLAMELDAFVRAVRDGDPSPVTATDGLWALELAEMLLTSSVEKRPVEVEPMMPS